MKLGIRINDGSFGNIYEIKDSEQLALKRNLAEVETSYMSAIRELNILYIMRHHPNIIKLEQVVFMDSFRDPFSPLVGEDRVNQRDDSVHFSFKQATYDLHDYIHEHNQSEFKNFKKIMVDTLLGLEYMHGMNIIHRDIKPGNILLFATETDCIAKICDFGFAKPYTLQGEMTPGICTVISRAPEILLSEPHYGFKSDVWSLGCVFYEMVSKRTFVNEMDDDDKKIMHDILVSLPNMLTPIQFKTWVQDNPYRQFSIRNPKTHKPRKSWQQQMGLSKKGIKQFNEQCGSMDDFCDLLNCMMQFHPSRRYTTTECLGHRFFSRWKDYIADMRKQYTPEMAITKCLTIECIERRWMAETAITLFDNRENLEWYNHRCLFQAVDMFQRYLYIMHTHLPEDCNKMESALTGKIHDKFHTNLYFMACIYMTIKYFSTIHYPIPFSAIVEDQFLTPECEKLVQQFEGGLVKNCFEYAIYHQTVYEAADPDILSDADLGKLLKIVCYHKDLFDRTPTDIYQYYKNNLKNKDGEDLLVPFVL